VKTVLLTGSLFNRLKATVCFSLVIHSSLWSQILLEPHRALNNPLIRKLAQGFSETEALKAQRAPLQINPSASLKYMLKLH